MSFVAYQAGELHIEQVAASRLAREFGTPLYVYSRAELESAFGQYREALRHCDHMICYAAKANGNIALLNVLARLGAGFDTVSSGELERVLRAGGRPEKIVFSCMGKERDELLAALRTGVGCFSVESEHELQLLEESAAQCKIAAPIALRVNPDIDAKTHPHITTGVRESKFGVPVDSAAPLCERAAQSAHLALRGVKCHIGSQCLSLEPLLQALDSLLAFARRLAAQGIALKHVNIGGGLGVRYRDEQPPSTAAFCAALAERMEGQNLQLVLEPGRSIAARAGTLITRVVAKKNNGGRNYLLCDAAMNDLIRPALYGAWQQIVPAVEAGDGESTVCDVVGPVCEEADFLGRGRTLNASSGDLLAVLDVGAYGFAMSSNYNARPRPAEVMVDRDRAHIVRQRETVDELFCKEALLPN